MRQTKKTKLIYIYEGKIDFEKKKKEEKSHQVVSMYI